MKYMLFSLLFLSVTAQANPFMSVKERLRIHLWTEGIEERPVKKERAVKRQLPEELERALRKN